MKTCQHTDMNMYITAVARAREGGTMPSHAIANPEAFSWKQMGRGREVPGRLTMKLSIWS